MIHFDTGDPRFDEEIIQRYWRSLPPVDTLDAHICPECRHQGITRLEYVEPDLLERVNGRVMLNLRDTMVATPCGCHINLRRWQLAGYRYSDHWTAWEWRGEPRVAV